MEKSQISWQEAVSEVDREMPVEVMKDFDAVLLFGRMDAVGEEEITIRRATGEQCFPVLEEGSAVLVRCYDARRQPILLRARVTRADGMACRVGAVEWIPYQTCRKSVRYPLYPPAPLCVLDSTVQESALPCQLMNVSTNGACIVVRHAYAVGHVLSLQIGAGEAEGCAVCPCRVVRAKPRGEGSFEYGLLFEPMNSEERSSLLKALQGQCRAGFGLPKGALHE